MTPPHAQPCPRSQGCLTSISVTRWSSFAEILSQMCPASIMHDDRRASRNDALNPQAEPRRKDLGRQGPLRMQVVDAQAARQETGSRAERPEASVERGLPWATGRTVCNCLSAPRASRKRVHRQVGRLRCCRLDEAIPPRLGSAYDGHDHASAVARPIAEKVHGR